MEGQFDVTQHPALLTEFGSAERHRTPLALPGAPPKAYDLPALCAFLFYLALSILFFGRALFRDLSAVNIGMGPDPKQMIWFLTWWPHALANGINPLRTHAIWAPAGYNLAWQTCIPLAGVIAGPFTYLFGPIATFNVICLLSLPLNAYCTFILCRYLSRNYWASLVGGYVFGFSAFMLGRLTFGHLNLLLAFPVPLIVYVAARRFAGQMAERPFVLALTLLLVTEFLLFIEIFATMTMFGGLALFLAWSFGATDVQQRTRSLIRPIAYSYAIAMVFLSPYLYYFFFFNSGLLGTTLWIPSDYSTDLLNFVVPTQANELGKVSFLKSLTTSFTGSIDDNGSCLTLPLVALSACYAYRHWHETICKFLVWCLIVVVILTLGPVLHVAGHTFPVPLPWSLFVKLPAINQALPVRLTMYAFLVLALIVSQWLTTTEAEPAFKIAFVAVVVIFSAPNLSAAFWIRPAYTPAFFRHDVYRQYLRKGETVVILPYADQGYGALWQAQAQMHFNMAQGAGGAWSDAFLRWPIVESFRIRSYVPDASEQLRVFLAAHDVNAVIVADDDLAQWQPLLSTLGVAPIRVGGVSLYRLKDNRAHDANRLLLDARMRFDNDRMAMLVKVASKYLADGGDLESLSMIKVRDLNLIPKQCLIGPDMAFDPLNPPHPKPISDPRFVYMLWLSPWTKNKIAMGEYVWLPAAAPMIEQLRRLGVEINYPDPNRESRTSHSKLDDYRFLLVVLTRDQLTRVAALPKLSPIETQPSQHTTSSPTK